tara:strand:+ start:444 stop:1538 length:1095 start_codon:yes stop_codon:yes gene_type:complete
MDFAVNVPLNSVSFGQVSIAILKELKKKGHNPSIFPISENVDLSTQEDNKDFTEWITRGIQKANRSHKRDMPTFKLWHINGSLGSFSKNQILFTFYELDQPTPEEVNIVKNNSKVLFSSSETTQIYNFLGIDNVHTVPLGFDKDNFHTKEKTYFKDNRITFNVVGKFEKRKHHQKLIKAWLKKYGNKEGYFLQISVFNPFIKPEDNQKVATMLLENKKYFNVNFYGFMAKNSLYNDFLNSGDIILGMSGGEGWGLPEFHSVAMGKHAVILNASAYKEWANEKNSVLVDPCGKIPVYDNMFFQEGQPYNQGNIYNFDEDAFIEACEEAVKRTKSNRVNKEGLKLQEDFTYAKTTDAILKHLEDIQ